MALFLNYLCYLELSLTVLPNCAAFVKSLINSFEVPKSGKTTTKQINKSLKKHHGYIYSLYHWLGKIHGPRPPSALKGNSRFKMLLVKIFSLK